MNFVQTVFVYFGTVILALVVLYVAARLVSRAVVRTLDERERKHKHE